MSTKFKLHRSLDLEWKLGHGQKSALGTMHLRRQHVSGGKGCPHVPMVKRSQYIRIKNPLHKHFAGMPMVGVKNRENLPSS